MHQSVLDFGRVLWPDEVQGKKVLDVGSRNINGSLRPYIMGLGPASYLGVDICSGDDVDMICDACDLIKLGAESFDIIICTEALEHIKDWKTAVGQIKAVCRPEGMLFVTTRSKGFPLHNQPDYWRFEIWDLEAMFFDCDIEILRPDWQVPGVFMKAQKPLNFKANDLTHYEVCAINDGGNSHRTDAAVGQ